MTLSPRAPLLDATQLEERSWAELVQHHVDGSLKLPHRVRFAAGRMAGQLIIHHLGRPVRGWCEATRVSALPSVARRPRARRRPCDVRTTPSSS